MKCRFWLDVAWGADESFGCIGLEFDSEIQFVPHEGMEITFGEGVCVFDMSVSGVRFCMSRQLLIISMTSCERGCMQNAIDTVKNLVGIGWRVEPEFFDVGDECDIVGALAEAGVPVAVRQLSERGDA